MTRTQRWFASLSSCLNRKRTIRTSSSGLWGNAISIVADKNNFDEIVDLVRDKRHGITRDMMVLRLPRLEPHKAVPVLIELLADDEVAGQAVIALGKLKAYEARKGIERL